MRPLGHPRQHYWLVKGMAKRLGADVVGAVETGELDLSEWSGMVQACRGCSDPEGCRKWLDRTDHADAAPEVCRNRDRLARLAR
ncbi:DUF6455 family protein [Pelagovum pacificum]|uniref:DUF6455 domain-containing protein n=1 Tax=Pelagovum pacificum TaxID=2588711 RepID=A0A5C5GI71_9RHOB|nr:DUF6455 family protein [Pelagovum pacificum]QQA43253.1 hypothetical protein I8N54_01385 [Pelagovum pacificum]TNY33609.1 hypothetical protein FHY64_10140 [Pelagovum pacificum]